jgi:hypothetical protein
MNFTGADEKQQEMAIVLCNLHQFQLPFIPVGDFPLFFIWHNDLTTQRVQFYHRYH